jgi:aquaporin Z
VAGSPFDGVSHSARNLLTGGLVAAVVSAIAISPLGRLSGAHLNPAVTLAFRALGFVSCEDVVGYLAAQLGGALVGASLFRLAWGDVATSVGGGVTHPAVSVPLALGLEAGMTGVLVGTIVVFVSHERLARLTPLAIWPVIAVLIWQAGPWTGTSLNPARSAGPALVAGDLADLWLYVVAPVAGALCFAVAWRRWAPSQAHDGQALPRPRLCLPLRVRASGATPGAELIRPRTAPRTPRSARTTVAAPVILARLVAAPRRSVLP